jgi:hypothetical protein
MCAGVLVQQRSVRKTASVFNVDESTVEISPRKKKEHLSMALRALSIGGVL